MFLDPHSSYRRPLPLLPRRCSPVYLAAPPAVDRPQGQPTPVHANMATPRRSPPSPPSCARFMGRRPATGGPVASQSTRRTARTPRPPKTLTLPLRAPCPRETCHRQVGPAWDPVRWTAFHRPVSRASAWAACCSAHSASTHCSYVGLARPWAALPRASARFVRPCPRVPLGRTPRQPKV